MTQSIESPNYVMRPHGIIETDKIMQQIQERHYQQLLTGGQLMRIFHRIESGERCTCFNDVRMQSDSRCPDCFGTTYAGGYDYLGKYVVRIDPEPEDVEVADSGLYIKRPPSAWLLPWPVLKKGDFLVNVANERFLVENRTTASLRGLTLSQQVTLHLVELTDIIYEVKLPSLRIELT